MQNQKYQEAKEFIIEEWISNWERENENITKEEVFLMLYRFSVDFLQEDWKPNLNFEFKNDHKPSDWARDSYFFIVSEWIDDWKNPKDHVSKGDLANILFNFFKEYNQFKSKENPKDWCISNWIIDWDFQEKVSRIEFWNILLKCTEVLEG